MALNDKFDEINYLLLVPCPATLKTSFDMLKKAGLLVVDFFTFLFETFAFGVPYDIVDPIEISE